MVAAWTSETLAATWRRNFSNAEVDQIDTALRRIAVQSPQFDLGTMTAETFLGPAISARASELRDRVVDGQGVAAPPATQQPENNNG